MGKLEDRKFPRCYTTLKCRKLQPKEGGPSSLMLLRNFPFCAKPADGKGGLANLEIHPAIMEKGVSQHPLMSRTMFLRSSRSSQKRDNVLIMHHELVEELMGWMAQSTKPKEQARVKKEDP
jgi:hypothetical protein